MTYGRAIHALRRFTQASLNREPAWRGRAAAARECDAIRPRAIGFESSAGIGRDVAPRPGTR